MTNKEITRFCSVLLTALGLSGEVSRAQSSSDLDQLLQIGLPNTAPVLAVPLGAVNLSNGNLHLEIPIKTVPQAGTMPALTFKLVYDSLFWKRFYTSSSSIWEPSSPLGSASSPGSGWRWVVSPSTSYVTNQEIDVPGNSSCDEATVPSWSNFSYSDSSGTTHVFDLSFQQSSTCNSPPGVQYNATYASDGSGYYIYITTDIWGGFGNGAAQVWDPHGNQVYNQNILTNAWTPFEDANGNLPVNNFTDQNGAVNIPGVTSVLSDFYVNTHFSNDPLYEYDYAGTLESLGTLTLPGGGGSYTFQYDQCPGILHVVLTIITMAL
jgi:hypothetical protein